MKIPTDDQSAQIRFAYRVYATGSTYGASAALVQAANAAIDKIIDKDAGHTQVSSNDFRALYIKHLI